MSENQPKKTTDREYYLFAFRIIGDFGATIAVPVVIFVLIGQYLDGKYDKGPWFTVLAFIVASLLTAKIVHKKAVKYGAEYEKLDKKQ
ncbi:AtpZ/AtpI family protein [Patescibacteria group bacterium]|nr:AtpZ/AtpI family protein [Patescibacteria group bacterium]MBU1612955.1 AtpZ/AtpI family protein [Patescibacteria group bacterium]